MSRIFSRPGWSSSTSRTDFIFLRTHFLLDNLSVDKIEGMSVQTVKMNLKTLQALHVGDRFTTSGNDMATRDCCCILWVANPDEVPLRSDPPFAQYELP